jgi:hypothetical protein
MFIIVILILAGLAFFAYRTIDRSLVNDPHPWQHSFDNLKFSADEFYQAVEVAVKKREIPDVRFSRVNYSEGNLLSANREYLHVVWHEHVYDVCAAPFGTSFFVSSWYVENPSVTKKLLGKIKGLEQAVGSKTYYQADTEAMFKGAFKAGLMEAIDEMTNAKGARALSELERQFSVGGK